MKKYFIIVLSSVLLVLSSCTSKETKIKITRIDSLENLLNKADSCLLSVNLDSVKADFKTYQETVDTVSKYYDQIRTDESFKYICALTNTRKPLKNLKNNFILYQGSIDSSLNQLQNLRHDVSKKIISDQEFAAYFANEASSVHDIYNKVFLTVSSAKHQQQSLDTVRPYLLNLVDDYKKKNR